MEQALILNLRDILGDSTAFGNQEGRTVYQKLLSELDAHASKNIIGISLNGITRTDASFPRESVISLAKSRRGEKGFYLRDFISDDLFDNWNYAAIAKDQSMIVVTDAGYKLLGKEISDGLMKVLDFIMASGVVTTSIIANHFDVSAQNASAKLKKLISLGLILSSKQAAETGGIEFLYKAIK